MLIFGAGNVIPKLWRDFCRPIFFGHGIYLLLELIE